MAIRWDSVLVRHVAHELNEALQGARLRALRLDGATRDLLLLFRDRTLVWRLHPERGALHFHEPIEPEAADLRMRARVRGVSAPVDERIVHFELLAERGARGFLVLVVELVGNRWNAVVIEGPERTIRHVLVRRDGARPLSVGLPYAPPPPTGRATSVDEETWNATLTGVPPERREGVLLRSFGWTSPLNASTILGAAATSDAPSVLAPARERWLAFASGTDPHPVQMVGERGLQPYPFPLVGVTCRPTESLLAALEECQAEADAQGEVPVALAVPPGLLAALDETVRHHERRLARLRAELRELPDPVPLRALGDLILARYADIPRGAAEVSLVDFDGVTRPVKLDAALAPHENADRYYARASRSERAAQRLPGLIEAAEGTLDRVERLRARALTGEASPDEVRAALPPSPEPKARAVHTTASLPYRTYRSTGGLEIRVGRGAGHNDDLTFRHSAPGDVWLHARHTAGAHVVLRWPGDGAPPARDLQEAATLAAVHSKARTSGTVPVDWTYRKYVRKPRGAAPGSVLPDRVKTLFVEPDEELAAALAERD